MFALLYCKHFSPSQHFMFSLHFILKQQSQSMRPRHYSKVLTFFFFLLACLLALTSSGKKMKLSFEKLALQFPPVYF